MHIHIHHTHAHAQEQQQKVEQTIPVAEKELGISVLVMCILLEMERIGNGKNGIISEKYVQNVSIDFEIMFAIQFFKKNP